jgi:hypothetical protein
MSGSKSRFAAGFGVALAVIASWGAMRFTVDLLDSRKISLDPATIKYNPIAGDWSVRAYNGSGRQVGAILVRITVPITEVKRVFRLAPRGLLGNIPCPPYSLGEFRADLGGFLPDRKIHGIWKIVGVEFTK